MKRESGLQRFSIPKPIRHLRNSLNLGIDPFTYGIGDRKNKIRHNTVQMTLHPFMGMIVQLHRRSALRTRPPQLFLVGCPQLDPLILQVQLHTLDNPRFFDTQKVPIQFCVMHGSNLPWYRSYCILWFNLLEYRHDMPEKAVTSNQYFYFEQQLISLPCL